METFLPFGKDNLSQTEKSGGTREVHGRQPRFSLTFRLPTCRKISGPDNRIRVLSPFAGYNSYCLTCGLIFLMRLPGDPPLSEHVVYQDGIH